MALNWNKLSNNQTNTNSKTGLNWSKIENKKVKADTTRQSAFNILNSASKIQSYNNVNPINNASQKSTVTTNNTSSPTQMSVTSNASTQKVPVFKTLKEAQEYAKSNNLKISNWPNEEQVKNIEEKKKPKNETNALQQIKNLGEFDNKDYLMDYYGIKGGLTTSSYTKKNYDSNYETLTPEEYWNDLQAERGMTSAFDYIGNSLSNAGGYVTTALMGIGEGSGGGGIAKGVIHGIERRAVASAVDERIKNGEIDKSQRESEIEKGIKDIENNIGTSNDFINDTYEKAGKNQDLRNVGNVVGEIGSGIVLTAYGVNPALAYGATSGLKEYQETDNVKDIVVESAKGALFGTILNKMKGLTAGKALATQGGEMATKTLADYGKVFLKSALAYGGTNIITQGLDMFKEDPNFDYINWDKVQQEINNGKYKSVEEYLDSDEYIKDVIGNRASQVILSAIVGATIDTAGVYLGNKTVKSNAKAKLNQRIDDLKVLGLSENATPTEIKTAYRKMAKMYHPDSQNGDVNKFRQVAEAYQRLATNINSSTIPNVQPQTKAQTSTSANTNAPVIINNNVQSAITRQNVANSAAKNINPFVQNVVPQSSNTQIKQQTNEVIPQQTKKQQNTNLVQNSIQITQNTPKNEQIPQNNIQNAQDLQKTEQNMNDVEKNINTMYNQNRGEMNEQIQREGMLGNNNEQTRIYEERQQQQINKYTKEQYAKFEQSIKPIENRNLSADEQELINEYNTKYDKEVVLFNGNENEYSGGASLTNNKRIFIDINSAKKFGYKRIATHEVMESDILHDDKVKNIIQPVINNIINDANFENQKLEFWDNQEGEMPSDYLIAKDIICDKFAEIENNEQIDYRNVLTTETNKLIDDAINEYKRSKNSTKGSFSLVKNNIKDTKNSGATVTTRKYEVSKINNFMNKVLSNMETTRFGNTKELRNITKGITRDIRADSLTEEKINQYANVIYDAANRIDTQYYEENKDLKNNIRNTRLYVSQETRSGITDWQDFRKSNFGILSISNEKSSLPVDTFYSELSKERADLFPDNIVNEIDQLERISEVAKSIRKIEQKASEYLENNYGKEVRDATIEEIKKNINELSSDIKQVQKVEADNLKKTTEKEELRLLGNDLTVAEIKELHKQNEVLKRDYEKAYRKELLTEKDKKQLDRLVKGEITLDEISGTSNREAIKRLYEYKKPLEDNNNKILQAKKAKKAIRFETAEEAVKNSGTWKDKKVLGGLRYGTETAERNIYDVIPDETEAKKIVDTYFKPVHIHEAQATRKKNEIIEKIKKLNIDTKENYQITESIRSKINEQLPPGEVYKGNMLSESALVQLLGEKVINTKDIQELGADVSKIENATNVFREIYNELFELSNDALIANGYNSVEYRKDYFPHFTEEKPDSTIKKIASKLGIETSNQELATDLAGLTHTFKPGKKWVGNFLERKGKATDYNALKGLDTYLEPVMDVIYHTDDIQNLRALEDSIRYKYSSKGVQEQIDNTRDRLDLDDIQKNAILNDLYNTDTTDFSHFVTWLRGYTDNLSGKKSIEDRNMEHMLGRAAYNTMKNVEGRVASNMIGANINSALTNFIPIVQGWGEVSSGSMTKAMWDTARNAAKNDGLTDTSDFLVNRRGNDRLYKTTIDKISEKAGVLMTTIDEFTSETLVRAKYYDNIKAGMNEIDAMSNANEFAAQIMGDRSKGARPTSFNAKNPIAKMFTMFQLEVNNQYRYWLKDLPRNVKDEVGNSLVKALFKIFLGSWIYGELKEKITGSRSVTDPVDIVADTFKDVLSEDVGTGQTIMNLGNRLIDELPFISTLTGGGRIPISSAFPDAGNTINALTGIMTGEMDTGKATGTLIKELSKPAYYFLLPTAGGQVKKAIEGISAVANGGEYGIDTEGNKKLKFPIDTSNMNTLEKIGTYAKAATFGKYSLPTAKDYVDSGYKQLSAKKTQGYEEAIKKGISADTYLEVEKQIRSVKPDGEKFVNNERRTKIINIIEKQDLTKEQKEYLYKVFYKNEI